MQKSVSGDVSIGALNQARLRPLRIRLRPFYLLSLSKKHNAFRCSADVLESSFQELSCSIGGFGGFTDVFFCFEIDELSVFQCVFTSCVEMVAVTAKYNPFAEKAGMRKVAGDIATVVLSVQKNDLSFRDFKMICKLGLSLKYVRGPLRRFLCRRMVFHRFDHATHRLDATLQCPAHRDKVLSAHQLFAVLIDTLNAPMHRT